MIMHMIGKLGEDKKADWPSHLAEIVHAYNATKSRVTGYSPHYLMFGCWPRLLVDFIFPTIGSNKAPCERPPPGNVDVYGSFCERLIAEHPGGGAGPIDCRGMPTETVL